MWAPREAPFFATPTAEPVKPPPPRPLLSLAAITPGIEVEIRFIAFDGVRRILAERGIREGDVVVCRGDRAGALLLENEAGASASLDRALARFVEVDRRDAVRAPRRSTVDPSPRRSAAGGLAGGGSAGTAPGPLPAPG